MGAELCISVVALTDLYSQYELYWICSKVILQNRIIPDLLQMLLSNGMCLMGSLGLFLKILYCNYNFTNMYFEHM